MELCYKYRIYCPFYINKNCEEKPNVCEEWKKAYSIFKNKLQKNQFKRLEQVLKEK